MTKKKKRAVQPRKRKPRKRTTYVLLKKSEKKQLRDFAKFIPSLDKYKGQDKITSAGYGAFQKAKKKLRHTENLRPVTAKQAKHLQKRLVGGGIRALRLRNVAEGDSHSKVVSVSNKGVVLTSNGRKWEYHPVNASTPDALASKLIHTGLTLFKRKKKVPIQLHIWTSKGRNGEGASSPEKWIQIVVRYVETYENADEFVYGLAALVSDVGGRMRDPLGADWFKGLENIPDLEDDEE